MGARRQRRQGRHRKHQTPGRRRPKRQRPTRRKPSRQRSRRLKRLRRLRMDSSSAGSPSSREGGSSWTSSVTSMRSAPRIPSTRARSPWTAATAATRTSMRRRRACPRHTRPGRGQRAADVRRDRLLRQQQCPSACARRMGATEACWPARPGRPSWTSTTFPTTIDFEVADGLPVDPAGAAALDAEAGRQGVVVGGGRGQQVERSQSPTGIPGKAEYPMPDLVDAFPLRGLARARLRPRLFSARRASGRRRASRTT